MVPFLFRYWKTLVPGVFLVAFTWWCTKNITANYYKNELISVRLSYAEAAEKALQKKTVVEDLQSSLTDTAELLIAERERKEKVREVVRIQEVVKYVQNPNTGKCDLSRRFLYLHNNAASGCTVSKDAEAPECADVASDGVTASS